MKLGVIIPTRGDRPKFFQHCLFLLSQQTRQPDEVAIIDYPARGPSPDITQRYREGFAQLKGKVDVIAPFEDDDWYAPDYLKLMSDAWESAKTNLLGINSHIVYHVIERKWGRLKHKDKAPMSNTFINASALIRWPADDFVLTDIHLWNTLKGLTVQFDKPLSVSIKHGTGLTATPTHRKNWMHYVHNDPDMLYLKSIVDKKSFEFYHDFCFSELHPAA